jgi:hydrogenase nickel incorporation protein HypB
MELVLAQKVLKANDQLAQNNRARLDAGGTYAVNLLGSPGAGKTTLLEAALPLLQARLKVAVIEGDLATSRDAERIEKAGAPAVQINTGGGCHLDAGMVASALDSLDAALDLLFVENVGNLVCTAGFDLGERLRVVVLSVAEGDDKVEKYPPMFTGIDAVALNKIDLLPHVDFDVEKTRANLRRLSPDARVFELSARTGAGIAEFADFLVERRAAWLAARQ